MTPVELEKLKSEIKAEIMKELENSKGISNWAKVKKSMEPRLKQYKRPHLSRIENSLATLTRYTFAINRVALLKDDTLVDAKNFVSELIDVMVKYSVCSEEKSA
ncbi:hypothetical protein [Clostridium ganghwense]|uniref:Uncharacterized protein n=1 Tax=Clostridium ganghwense TaxID=312089 RepID=A0ABT4CTL7_9CLOT|nr:hypothetical protein [Clostridium ganghwense]MCY6372415.1 hypothetical protein [Clostridium ganghwense]